jgi:NitT/TauT family transport system substrate-binding protein
VSVTEPTIVDSRGQGNSFPRFGGRQGWGHGANRTVPPPLSSPEAEEEISRSRTHKAFVAALVTTIGLLIFSLFRPLEFLHAQPLTKIRVANIGGTFDHIQVAINGGVYRKYGFDVENIQVGSSATVVQALLAGEVSFAHVGAVPVVAAVASGSDLKIIAVMINRFNYVMVSVPELRRPQDLKGKTLAISRFGSGDEFVTREALRRWNIDPDKDVRFLQVGLTLARLAALQSRHVQASLLSPPQIVEVQRMGLNVIADLRDLDVEYAHYTLATKGSLIVENRPFVERFFKAYIDGIKFYRSNPEPAMAYLRKFSKLNDAELRIVYNDLRKRIREEPVPTADGIRTIIRSLRGEKEKELNPRQVIDTSFFAGTAAK